MAEQVRKALRAEVQKEIPAPLVGKAADPVATKQDWLTVPQLSAIAAEEEGSPPGSDKGYWWLALLVVVALGGFLSWLLRRKTRLDVPDLPITAA